MAFLMLVDGFFDVLESKFYLVELFLKRQNVFLTCCGFAFFLYDVEHEVAEVFDVAFSEASSRYVLETYA